MSERSVDAQRQRQRRPLRVPTSPRDVEAGRSPPPAPALAETAAPRAPRSRLRGRLARVLLLLAALYALGLMLYLSRWLPRAPDPLSRWWRHGRRITVARRAPPAVRFRDGDVVYADDMDGDPPEVDAEDDGEDSLGPLDPVKAVRGADGAPLSPREIISGLKKVRPRPGASEAAPPNATADAEAVRAAVAHALQVKMLPPSAPEDAPRRFRCVGWRATGGCSPFGPREPAQDAPCTAVIPPGRSGYCEVQDKDSGELFRVMHVHCTSLAPGARFRCFEAWDFATFPAQARAAARAQLADTSGRGLLAPPASATARGIVMVVYPKLVPSAYATVRALRDLGCALPVELWFRPDEAARAPRRWKRALERLAAAFGPVTLRAIEEPARHSRAVGFAAKIHAVTHSAFAQLLFLDADNAPAADPTPLFSSRAFLATGAVFWPDLWHPGHTIFNVRATSLVWELLGLRSVRMFEQESGQLLVDRARHAEPLALVNFYAFHRPSHLERLRLVWGDKDLFRLAWLAARAPFHMVRHPPALAGLLLNGTDFCGLTMAQHDPDDGQRVLFLHRNSRKLLGAPRARPARPQADVGGDPRGGVEGDVEGDERPQEDAEEDAEGDLPAAPDGLPDPVVWTHLLSFTGEARRSLRDYVVDVYWLPPAVPAWQSCFGVQKPLEAPHFALQSVQDLPFAGLERRLRAYAFEAAAMAHDGADAAAEDAPAAD